MSLAQPTFLFGKIYSNAILLIFTAYLAVHYFIMLIFEKLAMPEDRERLWRIAAHKKVKFIFKIARIKLHYPDNLRERAAGPTVFASNHPSMLDGLIYFALLGPDLIPLTEPLNYLAFPFNRWFSKMGVVGVLRDEYDEAMANGGLERAEAISALIGRLNKEKLNVLIFPEGHYERINDLHYFHTGAARVAIGGRTPVIPLALINEENVRLDNLFGRPGRIYIRAREPLSPPDISPENHEAVKQFSGQIAEAVISLLPKKSIPMDINDPEPEKIGVFVDIDHTVYSGYSQQDFVKWLMEKKKISWTLMLKIFHYIFLEKTRAITHEELMKRALGFLKGWKVKGVEKLAEQFFRERVIARLQPHMLPILKDHQERGHKIIFITEVMEPLAKQFQKHFGAVDYGATLMRKAKNGAYTGEVTRLCWKDEKARQTIRLANKHNIDLRKSYGYGDSAADIAMLKSVKHQVAVHPQPELKHTAMLEHWMILQ